MQFVKSSANILYINPVGIRIIEAAGRVCYKSEEKITPDSAKTFVRRLIKMGHESVLEHTSATVRIICDRGISHEIVRHRLASYSQESTRYCNYGTMHLRFIDPDDFELDKEDVELLGMIEKHYNNCLERGRTPQQARYFLPNGLKTELVMTANMREWRHFFKLRTDRASHPQLRAIVCPLLEEFKSYLPDIFDDITYDVL